MKPCVGAARQGAGGVMLGRAVLYGLTAAGESGARAIIDMFKTDLVRTLNLLGCPQVRALNRDLLAVPDDLPI